MAYKRYFYRNGNKFGPYYYESYRDETGKVRKRYIGTVLPEKLKENKRKLVTPTNILSLLIVLSLIIISGIMIYRQNITGKLIFLQEENLIINLKKGELLPINSKLIIEQNNSVKEILLSELIESNAEGSFYIENKELSGKGLGYGFVGEKTTYPAVLFKLKIYNLGEESEEEKEEVSKGEVVEIPEEEKAENITEIPKIPEETPEINKTEQTPEMPVEENVTEEPEEVLPIPTEEPEEVLPIPTEELEETPTTPTTSKTTIPETIQPSETKQEKEKEEKTEIPTEEIPTTSETPTEMSAITGQTVKEPVEYVEGSCSKNNPFTYQLEEGKTASVKKNSVEVELEEEGKIKKKKLADNEVNLQVSDNEVSITTDYFITEQGFGKDFLQDEENYIEINLEKLGIEAKQGTLKISLVYQDIILAEASEEISVEKPVEENVTLPEENITIINEIIMNVTEINITIINETLANITTINITLVNETLINVTFVSKIPLNVTTKQYKAVVGIPVKWIKVVNIKNLTENPTLELPKESWNITIKTGKEIQDSLNEIERYEQAINETNRASLITGQVTGDVALEIKKRQGILTRFWNWITELSITGKVIQEQEIENKIIETQDSKIIDLAGIVNQIQETEIAIEYYTKAPTKDEINISGGKRITVSGAEELNYTEVLTYTSLDNKVSVNDTSKIKLYWIKEIEREKKTEEEQKIGEIAGNITQQLQETINETQKQENLSVEQPIENVSTENLNNTVKDNITEEVNAMQLTNETSNSGSLITGQITLESNITNILNNSKQEVLESAEKKVVREEVNFTVYDLDEDGMIDYIEWIVEHLSNQTYELIIEISRAEHLDENRSFIEDVYDYVKEKDDNWTLIPDKDYLRVTFEKPLDKTKDITIYARVKDNCISENNSVMINGTEVPCSIYQKKKRIDEIRRLLENG